LVATLLPFGAAYWLLPEYQGTFYLPYWRFLRWVGIPTLCLAPLYFAWVGRRVVADDDPYLMLGRVLARQVAVGAVWPVLRVHFLGWTIKAFFLPLMVVYLGREAVAVGNAWRVVSADYMRLYQFCYELSIFVDLLFCVVGYTLTLRALDSHIRSVEPTTMGWVAALACYQPFYSIVGTYYLNYEGDLYWDNWLAPYPLLRACWGTTIIVLLAVYALSTVAFGLRFSNLTHRGIVTGGPYRFVRHPAYLSKNASWWLISVPFVSQAGSLEALRHCALLLLLNLLYVLRAWTEERHLSRDPVYRDYSAWIARRGLFARLRRLMP
jgi:protein-S-isoprenylcysteine O-methyltransferase Ste14